MYQEPMNNFLPKKGALCVQMSTKCTVYLLLFSYLVEAYLLPSRLFHPKENKQK